MKFLPLIALMLSGVAGIAQVGRDTGEVTGVVMNAAGQPLEGVSVRLRDEERGRELTSETDQFGFYRFATLRPGTYQLRTAATEGNEVIRLHVRLGETTIAPRLTEIPGSSVPTFYVDATSERPQVDPERTQPADYISSRELTSLPVNRRNYLDLAMLTPAVLSANNLPDDIDLQVASNPNSGLSFNGNNGRFNTVALDGVENNYNSGSFRPSVSQDAIQEFQVNRTGFSVETGWATGGSVNIVTRSGTNEWHGTGFGFLRHRSIQASNFFDPERSAFTRTQAGASGGGPLRKDRAFLFLAFERLQRRETAFVPIFRDRALFDTLPAPQAQLLNILQQIGGPLAELSGVLRSVLLPSGNPATMALFAKNSGQFPFKEDSTTGLVRGDFRFTDRRSLAMRGNVTAGSADNSNFGSLVAVSRGRSYEALDHSLAANSVLIHSPASMSQIRLGYGVYSFDVLPLEPYGPELTIYGYGFFNRDVYLPAMATERRVFLHYTHTRFAGKHVWKFGGEFNPVRHAAGSDVPFGGRFYFSEGIPLGAVVNAITGDRGAATAIGGLLAAGGQPQVAASLASSATSLQAFNLGLPTLYSQTFGTGNWIGHFRRSAGFVQDSFRVRGGLQLTFGARYEIEGKNDPLPRDTNNLAGRFGFAWSPGMSGGSTVVRGGYGMYFGVVLNSLAYLADQFRKLDTVVVPITGIPGVVNPSTGAPVTSVDLYNGLRAAGVLGQTHVTAAHLAPFGIVPGPNLPFAVLYQVDRDFQNPLAHQASLEVEHAMGGFNVSASGAFVRGLRAPRSLDRNLYRAGTRPDGLPVFGLRDSSILQRNVFESSANSTYTGLTLAVAKRAAAGITLNAHYTWSKAMDSTTDFPAEYQPMDQTNVAAEWALSSFHVGHRFVARAVFESPVRPGGGVLKAMARNWTAAPIVIAQSYRPFNLLTGYDNLGDGHPGTKRPIGSGRNTGQGPGYISADIRLSRRFRLPGNEKLSLETIAEGFNVTNRTNFRTLNNVVGSIPLSDLPTPARGFRGPTSAPLAFTSAHDPRQFQLALRLRY